MARNLSKKNTSKKPKSRGTKQALMNQIVSGELPRRNRAGKRWLDEWLQELADDDPLAKCLTNKPVRQLLEVVAEHSPYLRQLCQQDTGRLARLLQQPADRSASQCLEESRSALKICDSSEDAMRILRMMKQEMHLLIALADIAGIWCVDQVVHSISDMADRAVSSALDFLLRQAQASGSLLPLDPEEPGSGSGLFVLALGKHGAQELNYSSDVDLIVFYDPETPIIPEGKDASTAFVRITRALVKILQEATQDGYVLRVDLRLRPDPGSTAVAISMPAAFGYYESVGQNWERAAYIKARPVAGDIRLGDEFLRGLTPFIWRKYFDYAAIADVHAMKRQIHAVRGHGDIAVAGHDIKLGRGGIREIEFFVQTQQLIFGGRREELRGRQTLDMLHHLYEDTWISASAVEELSNAYRFLRTIEHRLQMRIDEQTQRLPSDDEELTAFAQFCGFDDLPQFASQLTAQMTNVERHYAQLFEHAPELSANVGSLVFAGAADDPKTIETLRKLGFTETERAVETVRGWFFGRRAGVQSARAREVLTELVPGLIEAFCGSGDPDAALAAFDEALAQMPASVELLSILRSNAAVRELFGDILGGAPHMAQTIAQQPHVLDAAIDPSFLGHARDQDYFFERTARIDIRQEHTENVLDAMRDIALEESFLIGIRMFGGSIGAQEAGDQYSALASAMIATALKHVQFAFERDHGTIAGGACLILGLGKLGSREMTATSDLDLILLYDFDEENPQSDGRRSLHANQYYARLTQRLVSALTVPTRRGPLYEVDMRLRPSGRQGPVATNIRSFKEYQFHEAETWENMALSRANVIAGSDTLADEVRETIDQVINTPRDEVELRKAILDIRQLIADAKGDDNEWDLKTMSGGLIDIEFVAQFFSLRYGSRNKNVHHVTTEVVLRNALDAGLIDPEIGNTLLEAHRYYSAIMQTLRLAIDGDFDPETTPSGVLRRIAAAVNLPDFKTAAREISAYRKSVRQAYLDVLAG